MRTAENKGAQRSGSHKANAPWGSMLLLISAASFSALLVSPSKKSVLAGAVVMAGLYWFVAVSVGRERIFRCLRTKAVGADTAAALLGALLMAELFYYRWRDSGKVAALARVFRLSTKRLVAVAAFALAVGAWVFVRALMETLKGYWSKPGRGQTGSVLPDGKRIKGEGILLCGASAFGVITVCSKSSFLYPFNDWVDANCFFTVGKAMMNGVVVYRDLFEQKGPLLYFLHGIAWLISRDSFFGVYLLELAAAFFFLYYSYKSIRLYCGPQSRLLIPILAMLTYSSKAFCHGDSAEELCLPFLAYGVWVSLKALEERQSLSARECVLVGAMAGCVFWIKFTLVGFYIGWFLVPAALLVLQKNGKKLLEMVMQIAGGVVLATLPFVIYFAVNYAIGDWLEVYLYDNMFQYSVRPEGNVGGGGNP